MSRRKAADLTALDRYRPILGAQWSEFLDSVQRPLPQTLWTNTLKTSPSGLAALLEQEGASVQAIPWMPTGLRIQGVDRPGTLWPYKAGLYHLQEEVSMVPSMLLAPKPGERVLDLCSAPGGKSLLAACQMRSQGTVVANDISAGRLAALRHHLDRLGFTNVSVTNQDGSNLPPHGAGLFDGVLVDAPCSCEGTCRKNPGILDRSDDWWKRLAGPQRALLRKGLQLVRLGGRVVYSTCTFSPEENECVVDDMLKEYGEFVRLVPATLAGLTADPGLSEWEGRPFSADLRHCLRIWPHQNDSGGFFVAVFEKIGNPAAWAAITSRGEPPKQASPQEPSIQSMLEPIRMRHGFTRDWLNGRIIVCDGRSLAWVNPAFRPMETPAGISMGLPFVAGNIQYPKLATGAANCLAAYATNNCIDTTREQLDAFLMRKDFAPSEDQLLRCEDGIGYVLVRHQGYGIGVGLCVTRAGGTRMVESMFPKRWAATQEFV